VIRFYIRISCALSW